MPQDLALTGDLVDFPHLVEGVFESVIAEGGEKCRELLAGEAVLVADRVLLDDDERVVVGDREPGPRRRASAPAGRRSRADSGAVVVPHHALQLGLLGRRLAR